MEEKIRYAYYLPSAWISIGIATNQWIGDVPKNTDFNIVTEYKADSVKVGNNEAKYVGAFKGDVYNKINPY